MSNRKQALKRAESELAVIDADQRAELLKTAGIGPASQARALGAAFRMLEKAVSAENSIRVGKGGNSRLAKRPDWPTRVASSRTLIEWLAPVVKVAAQPSGRPTQVAVVLQGFAGGAPREATATVVECAPTHASDDELRPDDGYLRARTSESMADYIARATQESE